MGKPKDPVKDVLRLLTEFTKAKVTENERFSITNFLKQGMEVDEIKEALIKSYTSVGVEKPWGYFCSICKRIISRRKKGSLAESVNSYGKLPWG